MKQKIEWYDINVTSSSATGKENQIKLVIQSYDSDKTETVDYEISLPKRTAKWLKEALKEAVHLREYK